MLGFIVSNIFVTHCISCCYYMYSRTKNDSRTIQKSLLFVISKEKTRNREDETLKTCYEPCVVSLNRKRLAFVPSILRTMLAEYAADPSGKWVAKDVAVSTVSVLSANIIHRSY